MTVDEPLPVPSKEMRRDSFDSGMFVVKRDGRRESVHFDKITSRIQKLMYSLDTNYVRPAVITQKVIAGIYSGVRTEELDALAAETAACLTTKHPDYALLAARIAVSNLHKQTKKQFSAVIEDLYHYIHPKTQQHAPLISTEVYNIVKQHADRLNSAIIYDRDFEFSYFGFKTLEKSYLLRIDGHIVERPQHLLMRVALGIHGNNIERALETYHLTSEKLFTHATPTLFYAGTPRPQMSSCFLLQMKSDSIEGIYDTLKDCALISKSAGGIGVAVHKIRASGSYIGGTNGTSNGLVPMLRVYNETARYVNQGGGKRNGSFAMYLEPWHADIFDFLDLRKNTGKEENRARDLFLALWMPDLFMKRVEANGDWSLFCPHEAPGLYDCYGETFEALYERYEREGKARRTLPAQKLWFAILESQIETGTPYILYKDACNEKSNQKNLGTIQSSNLCTEIIEYTAPDEVAVCNLASLALPKFVVKNPAAASGNHGNDMMFDFDKLVDITKVVTYNMNQIINRNHYPVPEAERSNKRHRPIGLGVQGLADVFLLLRLPFESPEARQLNRDIFEAMYYGALRASCDLAREEGPYETFPGSPLSEGILQFDMWHVKPSARWDWEGLRADVRQYGARNSLLMAPMPTASTSQILGNNECFEPYTSNIYTRRVLSGEFQVVNHHLLKDLTRLGLWNESMRHQLMANNGSVWNITEIPEEIRCLYKTAWEIPQKCLIDMAADRGAFIDQSQSVNVFMKKVTFEKLTSMHFYGWKKGLKTGMYYLRTQAAVDAIKFTVDQTALAVKKDQQTSADAESGDAQLQHRTAKREDNGAGLLQQNESTETVLVGKLNEEEPKDETRMAEIMCSLSNPGACEMCGA